MTISSAASVAQCSPHAHRQGLTRAMLTAASVLTMLLASTRTWAAPTSAPQASTWEFRVPSGMFVPTGIQRSFLKGSQVTAAQVSWLVRPAFAITGTFGWARSRDLTSANAPKLDGFTSDLGVEARPGQWFTDHAVKFSPFMGLGAGVRSYNYRQLDVNATHNLAGYGALGGDLDIGRLGLRLEVRDYATGFKPLVGAGKSVTHNDLVIMTSVRFNFHRASQD